MSSVNWVLVINVLFFLIFLVLFYLDVTKAGIHWGWAVFDGIMLAWYTAQILR